MTTDLPATIINKRQASFLTVNGSDQAIHTVTDPGRTDIALSIDGTVSALMMVVFTDDTNAFWVLSANCGIGNLPLNIADLNGSLVCPLYPPFQETTLIFTYTSGVLYVKTEDGSSVSNCIFNFNSNLGFPPATAGLNYRIDSIVSCITGTSITIGSDVNFTNGRLNISPITGMVQINGNEVLSVENIECIPKPTSSQVGQSSGSDTSDVKYRGAIYDIIKPVRFSKALMRVNQPASTASTLRFSLYQRTGGKAANSSIPATLISTSSTGLNSVGSPTDTNILFTLTGSNFLSPGVFYGMINRDSGGGNVSAYCYTNNNYDIFNAITGSPPTFTTSFTGVPSSFDPTDSTNVVYTSTNVSPIFRLIN